MESKKKVSLPFEAIAPMLAECLEQGTDTVIPITGTSMLPLLRQGTDRVMLTAADADSLKVGDLPLYRRKNGQYVLHRLVDITPDGYVMQGDNQTFLEPGIQPDQILAVAKGIYRGERFYACDDRRYRRYVRWWMRLRFMRRFLLKISAAKRRLFGRKPT